MKKLLCFLLILCAGCVPVTPEDFVKKGQRKNYDNRFESHQLFMKAIELDSTNSEVYEIAAWNICLDSINVARKLLYKSLEFDSSNAGTFFSLGEFYLKESRWGSTEDFRKRQLLDSAILFFDKAIQHDSTNSFFYYQKASSHSQHLENRRLYIMLSNESRFHEDESFKAFCKACDLGDRFACIAVFNKCSCDNKNQLKEEKSAEAKIGKDLETRVKLLAYDLFTVESSLKKDSFNAELYYEKGMIHMGFLQPDIDSLIKKEDQEFHFIASKRAFQKACSLGYRYACGD